MVAYIESPKTTIVVPYVAGMLRDETKEWARGWADAQLVELDQHDDTAYYELLKDLWQKPGDLILIEQDIVPTPYTITNFLHCRASVWCTSPYTIASDTVLTEGLGCVRFSAGLKERWPGIMSRVGYIDDDGSPPKTWRRLDTRVARVLTEMGFKAHSFHHGRVEHLHDYRATD